MPTQTKTEDLSKMEETAQTEDGAAATEGDAAAETIAGESVEDGNAAPDEGEKSAETGDSADETLAQWPDPADSAGNTGSEGDKWPNEADLNTKIAKLEAELAESRDQLLRKAADFENFRKRMNQEKQNAIDFANQSLLLDIIPVIDDFERAIQSAESSAELAGLPAGKAMLDGITMIEKRLISQLEGKWGLKRFSSAGEPFDPNRHEAMMMEKSPDVQEPVVQEDFVKGYTLKDRVIRAAKVKVIMPEDT
jgi:molecular chaperone GrpE